ncbi:hypothetical protein PL9214640086 [Planktothrix tepida PCC 9214]|uniref:Uncharacterized protein n=1 Tax=Planktothrix tepida PCC 9214 TaxID=671072 RepID=A0A1J1LNT2_9CYAN|nr:hypothetical protein PL9214640086 [Planktothrix tepida PCC 9214]
MWFGLSPVIKRNFEDSEIFYQPTGPQFTFANGGGEAGLFHFPGKTV